MPSANAWKWIGIVALPILIQLLDYLRQHVNRTKLNAPDGTTAVPVADEFKWLHFTQSMLPVIMQSVQAMESQLGPGQGALKKSIVLDTLTAVPSMAPESAATAAGIVGSLIDKAVAGFNLAGLFTKSSEKSLEK